MGTLQNVTWSGDFSSSPILTSLQAAATNGLAVKLTADLHQNDPANIGTPGDMFCYGRILGTIGPALSGELSQVVPGRCIQTYVPPSPPSAAALVQTSGPRPGTRNSVVSKIVATAPPQTSPPASSASQSLPQQSPPQPWNPAFCVIDTTSNLLSVDIGSSIVLEATTVDSVTEADGTFAVNSDIAVGVLNPSTQIFTPFTNGGALTFEGQYQLLADGAPKTCQLVKNSGVFTFAMTAADLASAQLTPLAISVDGTVVAAELSSGYWIDIDPASQRLQCDLPASPPAAPVTGQAQIMVRQWGNPVTSQAPPITAAVQLYQWTFDSPPASPPGWNPNLVNSDDLSVTFGTTDANGIATVTTTVHISGNTLPAIREPLDSYMYWITLTDPQGNAIGDGTPYSLSVLLWNPYQAPASPTWADAGPVFASYARLYPGMQKRLDISNEQTVQSHAAVILARMSASISDPAFMPVTRDLSPTTTQMMITYLQGLSS